MKTSPEMLPYLTLDEHDRAIHRSADDLCGREVRDEHGDRIGTVTDLVLDDREDEVRFLVVERGGSVGFGDAKTLIPVNTLTRITRDEVFVDHSGRQRRSRAAHPRTTSQRDDVQ